MLLLQGGMKSVLLRLLFSHSTVLSIPRHQQYTQCASYFFILEMYKFCGDRPDVAFLFGDHMYLHGGFGVSGPICCQIRIRIAYYGACLVEKMPLFDSVDDKISLNDSVFGQPFSTG